MGFEPIHYAFALLNQLQLRGRKPVTDTRIQTAPLCTLHVMAPAATYFCSSHLFLASAAANNRSAISVFGSSVAKGAFCTGICKRLISVVTCSFTDANIEYSGALCTAPLTGICVDPFKRQCGLTQVIQYIHPVNCSGHNFDPKAPAGGCYQSRLRVAQARHGRSVFNNCHGGDTTSDKTASPL